MLLSVFLSTYNDAEYLQQSIEAILNQSFTEFEFIIFNDASPDTSDSILRKYAEKDSRIRYIKNEINKGVVHNINYCCKIAKGKYLYGASSDDWICPEFFAQSIELLEKHAASLCFLDTTFFKVIENKQIRHFAIPEQTEAKYFSKKEAARILKKGIYVSTASAIVRLDSFLKQGCYSQLMHEYADMVSLNYIAGTEGFIYVPQEGSSCTIFPEHATKYNPHFREKINRLKNALDYFLQEKKNSDFFVLLECSPRGINYKGYLLLIYPKYWPLAPRLIWHKLKRIPRKIASFLLEVI